MSEGLTFLILSDIYMQGGRSDRCFQGKCQKEGARIMLPSPKHRGVEQRRRKQRKKCYLQVQKHNTNNPSQKGEGRTTLPTICTRAWPRLQTRKHKSVT